MKNLFLKFSMGMAVVAALSGCTMAPAYRRPALPVPKSFPKNAEGAPMETNSPAIPDIGWQNFITDRRLQKVVALALENNRDLRVASLTVERARAVYGIQRAELLPRVNAVGGGSKSSLPADLSSGGERTTPERYDVNLGVASWEIDFFGRIRSLKARALEEYLATEQARRSAHISLISAVAGAYLSIAADRENLGLAESTLAAQRDSYRLIQRRHDLGLVPEVDLSRAQTQVDAARGEVARFNQRVALDIHALVLLAGVPIEKELLPSSLNDIAPVRDLSPGIASDVLLRRPDVLQAESQLKAAYADIGAARAAFFPRISLTAVWGTASGELSGLFKSGQNAWNFAPQASLPIFDPRAWSAFKGSKAQGEIAVAQYEKTLQAAFREVADALAIRDTVTAQVDAQQSLVEAATNTYRLSNLRYEKGMDSYLSVLDAQRSLYAARQSMVNLNLARMSNTVKLFSVLGGGWNTTTAPAPTAQAR